MDVAPYNKVLEEIEIPWWAIGDAKSIAFQFENNF